MRESGEISRCSRGALLTWHMTAKGKLMPVDMEGDNAGKPHWSACKDAERYRKNKRVQALDTRKVPEQNPLTFPE